jgi:hypothetical protein
VAWNREHTALDELLQLEYEAEDSRHGGIGETWDAFRTRRIAELVEVKP